MFAVAFTGNMLNKAIFSIAYTFKYFVIGKISLCFQQTKFKEKVKEYQLENKRIEEKFIDF